MNANATPELDQVLAINYARSLTHGALADRLGMVARNVSMFSPIQRAALLNEAAGRLRRCGAAS